MCKKHFVEVITSTMGQSSLSFSDKDIMKRAVEEGVTAALSSWELRDKMESVVHNALQDWTADLVKFGIVVTGVASFIYATTKLYQFGSHLTSPALHCTFSDGITNLAFV